MKLEELLHQFIYRNRTAEGLDMEMIRNYFLSHGGHSEMDVDEALQQLEVSGKITHIKKAAPKGRKRGHRTDRKRKVFTILWFAKEKPRYKPLNLLVKKDIYLALANGETKEIHFKRDPKEPLLKFITKDNKIRDDYDHIRMYYKLGSAEILTADFRSISLKKNPNPKESETVYAVDVSLMDQ